MLSCKSLVFSARRPFPSLVPSTNMKVLDSDIPLVASKSQLDKIIIRSCHLRATVPCFMKSSCLDHLQKCRLLKPSENKAMAGENLEESSDDDDELCPVDCVREFRTDEELFRILEKAKKTSSLVVVDFYRTSCGSCKYIAQGFAKLCKGSGDQQAAVIFLKHNIFDEYDEQSEVADRLRIKAVPLFHFYKDGVLVEAFPTRDKERIVEAICKYTTAVIPQDF